MDELIKSLQLGESVTTVVTIWSVVFGILLAALLAVFIGYSHDDDEIFVWS